MKERLLFGAPHSFMTAVRPKAQSLCETEFREIWSLDDLRPGDDTFTAWICHPGHSFVISDDVLDRFKSLRCLVTASTGSNHIDMGALASRGIAFRSLLDDRPALENIAASAEGTFTLLLTALKRTHVAVAEVRAGRWRQREDDMRGRELQGRAVGVIGLGRIGRRCQRYAEAFGARVRHYDPHVAGGVPTLEMLFDESEVIIVACTLNQATRGMLDGSILARLRHGALLVNGARGEIVDEHALADLMDRRSDIRVATDVLANEVHGRQYESPLFRHVPGGRVVITPHSVGATVDSQEKAALVALDLVARCMSATGAG